MHHHFNWGFAAVVGAMQLSVSRVISALIEDSCEPYVYTEGPGVSVAGSKVEVNSLNIGDKLTQYQQMQDIFKWENLLALAISLSFLCLSKFTYQITPLIAGLDYYVRVSARNQLVSAQADRATAFVRLTQALGGGWSETDYNLPIPGAAAGQDDRTAQ